jgi:peptidoglycan/LPS O-acetylase OafA/YrhL
VFAILARQSVIIFNPELHGLAFYEVLFDSNRLKTWWDATYIHLHTRAGPIALGICAGAIHSYHKVMLDNFANNYSKLNLTLLILSLLLFFASISAPIHIKDLDYLSTIGDSWNSLLLGQHRNLFALSAAILLLIALHPAPTTRLLSRFLKSRILTPIAKSSYSAYLFHILVLQQVFNFLSKQWPSMTGSSNWFLVGTALTFGLTFLIASISYVLIEKPFIGLSHRHKKITGDSTHPMIEMGHRVEAQIVVASV